MTPDAQRRLLPFAALLTTLVLWASAFVAIRHLGEDFGPGPLALGRQLVAVPALAAVAAARRSWPRPARRDLPRLAVIGALWFGAYHLALNEAERRIDAGTASLLLQVAPVLLTALAVLVLGERVTRALVVGMLVSLVGVGLIGLATADRGAGDVVGVLLCLLACLAYAVSVVVQKPLLTRLSALDVTLVACAVGALVCLPFGGGLAAEVRAAPAGSVGWLVYLGVFPTAVAFTTYAVALRRLPTSTMAVSTYLVPPLTILIAFVALGEAPPLLALVGGAVTVAGVWWSRRGAAAPPAPPGRGGRRGAPERGPGRSRSRPAPAPAARP